MENYILANTAHQSNTSGFSWMYRTLTAMTQTELNIIFFTLNQTEDLILTSEGLLSNSSFNSFHIFSHVFSEL